MVETICITLALLLVTLVVIERLLYGMAKDSIHRDMGFLWSHYDFTLEDIKYKK
jgi:hypothetical protein